MLRLPLQEARVRLPVGEAGAPHAHVLQQTQVLHLVAAALLLEQQRRLDVVGLDAAHVVRFLWEETEGRHTVLATAGYESICAQTAGTEHSLSETFLKSLYFFLF